MREVYGAERGRGAAPAPLRGEQRLPAAARGGRAGLLGRVARPVAGRVRRAAPRGAPVLRRRPRPTRSSSPGPTARTRCSGAGRGRARRQSARAAARGGRRPDLPEVPAATVRHGRPARERPAARPVVHRQVLDARRSTTAWSGTSPATRSTSATAGWSSREYMRAPRRRRDPRARRRRPGAAGRQYRHPVGMMLWELPAGLLDVDGEPPLEAARRELAEEADLRRRRWDVLIDWFNSPGGTTEALRLYLARDLSGCRRPTGTSARPRSRGCRSAGRRWRRRATPSSPGGCTTRRRSSASSPRARPARRAGARSARPTPPGRSTRLPPALSSWIDGSPFTAATREASRAPGEQRARPRTHRRGRRPAGC